MNSFRNKANKSEFMFRVPVSVKKLNMSSSNIYQGSESFRVRLVLSILSGRPIRIVKIRTQDDNPGLHGKEKIVIEKDIAKL